MDNFTISFLGLLGCILISRAINEKAIKKLDQDKKSTLIDLFSNGSSYRLGILIGIVVLYFLSLKFNLMKPTMTYIIYIVLLLIFMIISSYGAYKKLKENNFPDSYINSYLLSTTIRFMGLIVFFLLMEDSQ